MKKLSFLMGLFVIIHLTSMWLSFLIMDESQGYEWYFSGVTRLTIFHIKERYFHEKGEVQRKQNCFCSNVMYLTMIETK